MLKEILNQLAEILSFWKYDTEVPGAITTDREINIRGKTFTTDGIQSQPDGSGSLGEGNTSWDKDGNLIMVGQPRLQSEDGKWWILKVGNDGQVTSEAMPE